MTLARTLLASLGGAAIAAGGWLAVSALISAGPDPRQTVKADYRSPAVVPYPKNNPYSDAKIALGQTLFYDPLLSVNGTLACASCHLVDKGYSDGRPRAIGATGRSLPFHSPSLVDVAWIRVLGWDGKFPSIESVAFAAITNPANMGRTETDLIAALSANPQYRHDFAAVFPDGAISRANIEMAIASFERTIVAKTSPFDRWIGGDEHAVSAAAKRGFDLFNGKAGCNECHSGWNFTDGAFYDIGTAGDGDIGRARLFPNSVKLQHAFKVPTLRDVAVRAPYMHDGSVPTLEAVIDLYDRGGIDRPSRSELIHPLGLTTRDKSDLVAFLQTLTSESDGKPVVSLP